ncbi:hypothetical protein FHW83_001266 [Duganella sp. SG902]|uniref:hypothetical protein n=1 Tax=Duganella sp. SG902 TaxID=2587016 RepID=UPI00159DFE45|nr:hypothetical protein [Duganella sp. SG902]NVM75486.1 hypothetical protein [Duganella sp. SG902]
MNAYQNFLDFFSMHNKERLDGLSESYFTDMTPQERNQAFDFLLARVKAGGDEESMHGLFRADAARAVAPVKELLASGALTGEAQIAAAWNLWQIAHDEELLSVFIEFLHSPDEQLREKAAYYVPAELTAPLKTALQGMIRTETERLVAVHAVNKLLDCYDVSKESVGEETYLGIYRGLRSQNLEDKEAAFKTLDALYA